MKEIEQIVTDYLSFENTDYAVMINGDWGCGKTYYVKKDLFAKISTINSFSKDKNGVVLKYEPIYISLYGISEMIDVSHKIQLELNPWMKGKPWEITRTGINKLASIFNLVISKDDEKKILSIFKINKNKVLFFDDLERIDKSKISFSNVLGQINNFTEQDNLKVIIVCNSTKTNNIFDEISEKTIRFSCKYEAILKDVYDSIIFEYSIPYKDFLKEKKQIVMEIFEMAKYQNLRTLRFILDIFQKIFNQQYESEFKNEVLTRFFIFTTIYSVEYKIGHSKVELNSLESVGPILKNLNLSRQELPEKQEKEPVYWQKIEKKYSDIIDSFYFCKEIADYILNGYLNESKFKYDINDVSQRIKLYRGTEEDKLIREIKEWRSLADDEFLPLFDTIIRKIESDKFSLLAYPVIYAELLQIEYFHIDDFRLTDEITQKFIQGIDNAKERHVYIELFERKIPIWDNREISPAKDKYNVIYKYAIDANNFVLRKMKQERAKNFLYLIENNMSEELQTILSDHKNRGSIFEYLQVQKIFDKLLKSNAQTVNAFNNGLYIRYPDNSFNYEQERVFFNELQNLLEKYITDIKLIKISTVLFIDLNNNLKRIANL